MCICIHSGSNYVTEYISWAMLLDQLCLARPTYSQPCYQGQPKGVYLCGSGSHPGELLI